MNKQETDLMHFLHQEMYDHLLMQCDGSIRSLNNLLTFSQVNPHNWAESYTVGKRQLAEFRETGNVAKTRPSTSEEDEYIHVG